MAYYLRDEGYSFKKIYHGKNWVGRVYQRPDGKWVGQIGTSSNRLEGVADNTIGAFELVVANAMGFKSVDALRSHVRTIRARRRQARQHVRYVADEMLRGNFKPFDDLLTKKT